jgi:hypothetical protein
MSSVTPEIHEQYRGGAIADLAARRAYEQAWARFAQQQTPEEFCASWLLIQCHAIGGVSDGVVVLAKPGSSKLTPVAFYPESPRDRKHLAPIIERALKEGRGVVEPKAIAQGGDPRYQLAYPVRLEGQVRGVVGVDLDSRPEPQLQVAMRNLQWGSCWLELLLRRNSDPQQEERLRLKLALDMTASLLEIQRFSESATAFATQLAAQLGCDRVALGLVGGKRVRVTAVSHSPHFERRANLVRAIESAMEEAIDQGEAVVYPPVDERRPVVTRAHEALLRESEAGCAATFPLVHGRELVGALTLERAPGYRFEAPTLVVCEAVAAIAGPIVELKRLGEVGLPLHAGRSARGLWEKIAGPGNAGLKLSMSATLAVAAFLSLATGDFRVAADATLQGVVQRAVTAPINGYVKEAPLRAGDVVKQDQVIGRFDDRDLRIERVKLMSERDQYDRQYREAMSKRERGQAQVVRARIDQAQAQLALVEEQLARTIMVAPFEGVIVAGDLSQSLGAPVERGQVLFEIAPLDAYRVALQVDERDIAYVVAGQRGELTIASMPGERFGITVKTVTPVNTAREGRNYFRVEAAVDADALARLRPGMQGVAKIHVDERKLVWIWTRGFTDWLRLWLWSWLP